MTFVSSGNADIWYSDFGGGESVLLVHGGLLEDMDGARFWQRPGVVDDLVAAGYRVLLPDRRYCGQSTAPFELDSWELEAADLHAVLTGAHAQAAHIVAGSNGCSAALHLALAHPDAVRSLVLCWPPRPDDPGLRDAFESAALSMERLGTEQYLLELEGSGVTTPIEPFTHYPWSAALLRDTRTADSFRRLTGQEAGQIVRASAVALLSGRPLRGMHPDEIVTFGGALVRVTVIPADPEDRWHTTATARELVAAVPGRLVRGVPPPLGLGFRSARLEFLQLLQEAFTAS